MELRSAIFIPLSHKTHQTMKPFLLLLLAIPTVLLAQIQAENDKGVTHLEKILDKTCNKPFTFSVPVADGNYKVTVVLGSKRQNAETVVMAESRRLISESIKTRKGEFKNITFTISKRSPVIDNTRKVRLKQREYGYRNWDDSLSITFCGPSPAVKSITIDSDTTTTTLFLCGNSTVVDQEHEPYASWGQIIPRWFDERVCIANHAESGLTARVFINSNRLEKVLAMMRQGDYVFCEFGHNDQKEHNAGDGAWYHYAYQMKVFVDKVRQAGGNIIFITPTQRRRFDDATHSKIMETHGDFPDAMRMVAQREGVPVIELHDMTRILFESLGYEGSKNALVHYPANTFPNQPKALEDNTHFNPYGAYEVAKMVIMGMKQLQLPISAYLRPDWKDYNPLQPDDFKEFKWYDVHSSDITKPDGN